MPKYLRNIKGAVPSMRPQMVSELRTLLNSEPFRGRVPSLQEFLSETGLELGDVYRAGCWSGLKRAAGVAVAIAGPQEEALGDAIARLLHVEDPLRLDAYDQALSSCSAASLGEQTRRLIAGLAFTLKSNRVTPQSLEEFLSVLHAHPAIVEELRELRILLDELSTHVTYPLDQEIGWPHRVPVSVHARHTMNEVLTAFGRLDFGRPAWTQTGVVRDEATNSDLFFVTLEKSERDYSPSTLYRDYAVSPTLFHWESQSGTSQTSPTGQRYIQHRERFGNILLFVRQRREQDGRTEPYTFLGPVDYLSHKGERPIAFVWQLRRPMPAGFFRNAKVAAG